ncbi:PEP-CTERM sorting domain-containing protein [Nostocaceae cyanobacterium CENA357]|uniref:PEP-CTERM sorting domain-containing protein n=1 Tax=Atlanticothrix silvestris CENA357 TaxID=1725252 RepID=A0A8J7HIN0_9CYAN|nr:PEP-CTERM sorting domain-containing protein [Atlanticothrix silvestris]MBH8553135.1 PEP-CTERM sorting domain-containing protein [Atlanticothrix silvestris CENA357]
MLSRNIIKNLAVAICGTSLFTLVAASKAQATTITFDDGTTNISVGNFYSDQGVTFYNASFSSNFELPGSSGLLGFNATNGVYQPTSLTPIIGFFSQAQNFVSIRGIDVGANGIRLDALDADGNLLTFDEFFGTGLGVGIFHDLSVTGDKIRSFRLYQPQNLIGDGVVFDNLTFTAQPTAVLEPTAVPEPATVLGLLMASAFGVTSHKKEDKHKEKPTSIV